MGLMNVDAWAYQPGSTPGVAPSVPNGWTADAATLKDAVVTPALRAGAARKILGSGDPGARAFVLETLRAKEEEEAAQEAFLAVLSPFTASGEKVEWIVPGIVARVEHEGAQRRAEWVACLGVIRTRDSLRAILKFAEHGESTGVREAAFASAVRLTGQYQFGTDHKRWSDWFAGVEWLPEPDWQRTLAEGFTQYAAHLEAQREAVLRRLIESERRRFIETTSEGDRWNLLAVQLKDELSAVRRLGVELTNRELANARLPAGPVPQAALGLLADPSPDLRIAGANLVERLSPTDAAPVIASILLTEKDPAVLASMVRLAARWPSPDIRARLLDWLDPSSALFTDALRAIDSIERSGMLTSDEDRAKVLTSVRSIAPSRASTAALRLRCVLGEPEDRKSVAELLRDSDPNRRLASAQALASFSEWLDAVTSAAGSDEALIPVAAGMIATNRPNAEGFRLLLPMATAVSASPGGRSAARDALVSLTETIAPSELLTAATEITSPDLREAMLARFATLPIGPVSLPLSRGEDAQSLIVGAGLLRLAQTRLELNKPGAALAAIDRLAESGVPTDEALLLSLRAQALLGVNRIADAIELDAPAMSWIVGLRAIAELPHAPSVLRVLQVNFSGQLTPGEEDALAGLRDQIAAHHPEGETTGDDSRSGSRRGVGNRRIGPGLQER